MMKRDATNTRIRHVAVSTDTAELLQRSRELIKAPQRTLEHSRVVREQTKINVPATRRILEDIRRK